MTENRAIQKTIKKRKRPRKKTVNESQIKIKKMASKKFEGWRILLDDKACGYVKFFPKIDPIFYEHVTVDFAIPKPKRGLHIGRFALKFAINSSMHKLFVAHLKKTNLASQKSLQAVGFAKSPYPGNQLCMIYRKRE